MKNSTDHKTTDQKKKRSLRKCVNGHEYYKSSDCPVCPVCEKEKHKSGIFSELSAPAQRALKNAGIKDVKTLSTFTQKELLKLHGMGPSSIPKLQGLLNARSLSFKSSSN